MHRRRGCWCRKARPCPPMPTGGCWCTSSSMGAAGSIGIHRCHPPVDLQGAWQRSRVSGGWWSPLPTVWCRGMAVPSRWPATSGSVGKGSCSWARPLARGAPSAWVLVRPPWPGSGVHRWRVSANCRQRAYPGCVPSLPSGERCRRIGIASRRPNAGSAISPFATASGPGP